MSLSRSRHRGKFAAVFFIVSSVLAGGLAFAAGAADKKNPTLSIAAPPHSKALTSDTIIVTGKAKDNMAVANVFWQLAEVDGTNWFPASTGNGWSNWWANVTLNAGANKFQAYAVDSSGNTSKVATVSMTFVAAPVSLDGLTATVTPDGESSYAISFGTKTFSENNPDNNTNNGVGNYKFTKRGPVTAHLTISYTAPPSSADSESVDLQFTNSTDGWFTDTDGANTFTNYFVLSQTTNTVVPLNLAGTTLTITNDSGESTNLTFPAEPLIVDNGHMFNDSNPLVISLSSSYSGQTNDRVSVTFIRLRNYSGQWIQTGTPLFYGTVIGFDTNADTVTILFDNSTFLSKTELFGPATGSPVNLLSYYYTNFLDDATTASGTGTYTFTPYSPVGALLQLTEPDTNTYFILTFVGDSDSGTYYEESYDPSGTNSDSGSFGLTLPPQITAQPQDFTTTNGGNASFSVTAIGSPTLTYQWQMNRTNNLADGMTDWGSTISGSASNVLRLTTVTNNDAGNYRIIIANDFGSVTSSIATLTISSSSHSPPGP